LLNALGASALLEPHGLKSATSPQKVSCKSVTAGAD
jgi:hypothetical protein